MPRLRKTERRRAWEFAWMLAAIGAGAAAVSLVRHHGPRALLFLAAGLLAPALAAATPSLWLALFRAWMKLGGALSWVMTGLILTVFHVVVVTPVGLARRMIGKPTLDTRWRDGRPGYWIDREPVEPTIERYSKRY